MSFILTLIFSTLFSVSSFAQKPLLLHAKHYQDSIHLEDYWVSEKLDGVRAFWDGEKLLSRQGHEFNAPQWFAQALPKEALDGELWISRNTFDELSGLVRQKTPNDLHWQRVNYMIFDLPKNIKTFDLRIKRMQHLVKQADAPHFQMITQFKVKNHKTLILKLDDIVKQGGEGLMLHKGSSLYKSGRSNDLLKLKKYFDAEAMVLKHIKGKGKYSDVMGALLVKTKTNIIFKIGSGFSDPQRANPPPIGALITYKYFGLTNKGTPKFASFMRIREKP